METKTILVQVRTVYGNELIYPICDKAVIFSRLTGKKTFSRLDIKEIESLGFEVIVDDILKLREMVK